MESLLGFKIWIIEKRKHIASEVSKKTFNYSLCQCMNTVSFKIEKFILTEFLSIRNYVNWLHSQVCTNWSLKCTQHLTWLHTQLSILFSLCTWNSISITIIVSVQYKPFTANGFNLFVDWLAGSSEPESLSYTTCWNKCD